MHCTTCHRTFFRSREIKTLQLASLRATRAVRIIKTWMIDLGTRGRNDLMST